MLDYLKRIWANERRLDVAIMLAATLLNLVVVMVTMFWVIPSIQNTANIAKDTHDTAERDYELILRNNDLLRQNERLAAERQAKIEELLQQLKKFDKPDPE